MSSVFSTIKNHWISILLVTVIAISASAGVTALQTREYQSSFSLLVIQKTDSGDAYAAAKSAQQASLSLAQILYTTSFYDQVQASGLADLSSFPTDEAARRELWAHAIETRTLPDVGMLKISAYDTNRTTANALAFAVADVLTRKGADYLGTGKSIELQVVDAPLTSTAPVRPDVPVNLAIGFLLGFGVTIGFHIVRDTQETARDRKVARMVENVRPVQQEVPTAQSAWQPSMPVVTTMFSPEAVARIHRQQQQPQEPSPAPSAWEMPDMRRNPW
ncbi:MAG: Wzz/FepE/Etk N-terminal domain-containing protein [bacterium]